MTVVEWGCTVLDKEVGLSHIKFSHCSDVGTLISPFNNIRIPKFNIQPAIRVFTAAINHYSMGQMINI